MPVAYGALLQNLQTASPALKIPTSVHALDKTTYLVEVLQEVIFDMASQSVTCIWVDGGVEEWPLLDNRNGGCMKLLMSVMDDVSASARAPEKPLPNVEGQKQQSHPIIDAAKVPRHKKQRSGLMQFVS